MPTPLDNAPSSGRGSPERRQSDCTIEGKPYSTHNVAEKLRGAFPIRFFSGYPDRHPPDFQPCGWKTTPGRSAGSRFPSSAGRSPYPSGPSRQPTGADDQYKDDDNKERRRRSVDFRRHLYYTAVWVLSAAASPAAGWSDRAGSDAPVIQPATTPAAASRNTMRYPVHSVNAPPMNG